MSGRVEKAKRGTPEGAKEWARRLQSQARRSLRGRQVYAYLVVRYKHDPKFVRKAALRGSWWPGVDS